MVNPDVVAERNRRVKALRRAPGRSWRVNVDGFRTSSAEHPGVFDEVVVDDWLHLEQMDTRLWWMNLGERTFWIRIPTSGDVVVTES